IAEVLGLDDPVGANDDFFTLSGDSLAAVELLAAISDELGVEVTGSVLLEAPTPAALAAAIAAGPRAPTTVVRLTEGSPERTPFFCAVGGGAHSLGLRRLARRLRDRTVFGIQSRSI